MKGKVTRFFKGVVDMGPKQYFLNNCFALKAGGLRIGDSVEIHPFQGRVRRLALKRSEYNLVTASNTKIEGEGTEWVLPSLASEAGFRLKISFVMFSNRDERDDGRYRIESLDGKPFKVNGVYTVEAWLMRGQILDFAHNRMIFSTEKFSRKTTFLEDIPRKVVEGQINILLEGETGTGKSHLAKLIHDASGVSGSFVHLNLAAFSTSLIESELFGHVKGAFTGAVRNRRGSFEMAHRGTLFLDEIDSLPWEIQTKLLLVLESMLVRPIGADFIRKVETRLIFASGRPLWGMVQKKAFREDFYYRIQRGFFKKLPSLREVPQLLEKLFFNFMEKNNVSGCPKLLRYYKTLDWPGNIRQFISHLEKKVLLSDSCYIAFDREDEALEDYTVVQNKNDGDILPMAEVKKRYTYNVLKRLGGDFTKAAKLLKMNDQTVRRLALEYQGEFLQEKFCS